VIPAPASVPRDKPEVPAHSRRYFTGLHFRPVNSDLVSRCRFERRTQQDEPDIQENISSSTPRKEGKTRREPMKGCNAGHDYGNHAFGDEKDATRRIPKDLLTHRPELRRVCRTRNLPHDEPTMVPLDHHARTTWTPSPDGRDRRIRRSRWEKKQPLNLPDRVAHQYHIAVGKVI